MLIKILEYTRIIGIFATFAIGYYIGFNGPSYDPVTQLHFMIPLMILFVAGSSGIEGLFFREQAAKAKGYETGSNYQIQSAIALLSYVFTSLLVLILNWGIKPELTVLFAFLFFFIFSAVNHLRDAIKNHNYKFANINRPILILCLIGGLIYPLIEALKSI